MSSKLLKSLGIDDSAGLITWIGTRKFRFIKETLS